MVYELFVKYGLKIEVWKFESGKVWNFEMKNVWNPENNIP